MPQVSRVFVFAAFCYLLVYAALPLLESVSSQQAIQQLSRMSTHLFTLGFLTQMIMAVAVWMFPRSKKAWSRPVGERLAWLVFGLLNTGLILRHLLYMADGGRPAWLQTLAGMCQFGALLVFVVLIWNRVQPSSQRGR